MRALVLALLVANAAFGTTVTLQRDGLPVPGEVCRFRAEDRENPFKRWLAAPELTCTPADQPLALPRGLWNVFGRGANGVSAVVLVDGELAPASLTLTLRPARMFEGGGIAYAPRLATAYPVPGLVPAEEPLWHFVLDKSKIVSVDGASAVLGWLAMPERDRAAVRTATGVTTPAVRASAAGTTKNADLLPPPELLHGAFVRFRDVAAGEGELSLEGRGWLPDRRRIRVAAPLTLVTEPLTARASGTLNVDWSTSHDLPALDRAIGSCEGDEKRPELAIVVSACPTPSRDEQPDPAKCREVRTEVFAPEQKYGSFFIENLVPGAHRAELRFGKLPPVGYSTMVEPLAQARVNVVASYIQAYGSVTRGGDPLGEDANVVFPAGVAFATADKSEYRGVLREGVGVDAQIAVAACDGEPRAVVLTDAPLRPFSRFDIDIPANELAITVIDTFTRERLNDAAVKIDILSLRVPKRVVMTRNAAAGEDGRVVAAALPERDLIITVSHAGYERQRLKPFSLTKSETRELEVQLLPLRGSRGKIASDKPFDNATAYWFSASGNETERAEVAPDGTFVYMGSHGPDETLTVVSASHPLWVSRSPRIDHRNTATLRFPDAPVREFALRVSGADPALDRYFGLIVAGLRVPLPALRSHQMLRRQAASVRGAGPVRIGDIVETGPIDVLLGPSTIEIPARLRAIDLFALPQFLEVPRQRLMPGAAEVTLEAR